MTDSASTILPVKGNDGSASKRGPLASLFGYFPARLMMAACVFSFLFMANNAAVQSFEQEVILRILHAFNIPSTLISGNVYVGNSFASTRIIPATYLHGLYLVFMASLLFSADTSMRIRARIVGFMGIMFFVLVGGQALVAAGSYFFGHPTAAGIIQISVIVNALSAGGVLEAFFFSTLALPKAGKVKPLIRRNYKKEYVYLSIMLLASALSIYFLLGISDITEDSVLTAYIAIQIPTIIGFRYYVSYFFAQTRLPGWASVQRKDVTLPVSFLIPAYNEEKTIGQLITSIDRAAAKYEGSVEIVLVNDGSKDSTASVAEEAFKGLKHASYKQFNTENQGKGNALEFGLQHCTGEIIFRLDGDSIADENCIKPIAKHFRDPAVGSVSGMIFPIELKSIWQKSMILLGCFFIFYKKGDEVTDSILVQPGAFSVFKRDALVKIGGWRSDQYGEDGEITNRLGRYGYKNEFEPFGVSMSEVPVTFGDLRKQRVRWALAFFHSRSMNLGLLKEFAGPRSLLFLDNLLNHGGNYPSCIFIPFFAAALIFGVKEFDPRNLALFFHIPLKIALLQILISSVEVVIYVYFLRRFKKLHYLKYVPFMPIYRGIMSMLFRPEALGILLSFTAKNKVYTKESYKKLRKYIRG
ncbi:MAG: glycosyltransferase [Nitrososphaera sp.]